MTRLRSFAASARQARVRSFAAPARLAFATGVAAIIFGSSDVLACPHCFGAEETGIIDGAKVGIVVMLAITFTVQGAFLAFFLYLRRRAKRMADIDLDIEWSELQRGSRTSS